MEPFPALLLGLLGIFLLTKVSDFGTASRLNLFISSASLSMSGITPVVNLGVTAQNVTSGSLQFTAFAGNAYLNGAYIGNVSGFTPVTIPPAGQVVIPLQIVVNASGLLSDIGSIFDGTAGVSAVLELKGSANIANLVLPVDVIYNAA